MTKLIIGFFIAILCGFSDYLLMYHEDFFNLLDNYQYIQKIPSLRNMIGCILGVSLIPFLYIGYWGMIEIADVNSKKKLRKLKPFVLTMILFGTLVHACYYWIHGFEIGKIQLFAIKGIETIFVIHYLFFILYLGFQSFKIENTFLYKLRYFNPIIYMVGCITLCWIPKVGIIFLVSGFNISIAYIFLGSMIAKKSIL